MGLIWAVDLYPQEMRKHHDDQKNSHEEDGKRVVSWTAHGREHTPPNVSRKGEG